MSNKKILIVGGTGVISFAVVNEAINQGFSVTCINRGTSRDQTLSDKVEIIHADYRNRGLIEEKLSERYFDTIIDVLCYTEKDVDYSVSLFKDKCDQYIFFSSCAVYNKGKGDYFCTEDSELINPLWSYSINKVKCEKKLKELALQYGFRYTIVRPAVTYGNTRLPYGITPPYGYHGTIIQRILHGKPIIIWDGGQAFSTITRVEDFAIGLVGLLGNEAAYDQAYHIVGDNHYKWIEVLNTLGKVLGKDVVTFDITRYQYADEVPSRKGEILGGRSISQLLDNSKIKDVVSKFRTNIELEDGIKMTVDYYKNNAYLKGIDWKFDAETDRIIKKYSKKEYPNMPLNTNFIDYMSNATILDKLTYFFEKNKENHIINICLEIISFFNKLKKYIKNKYK